MQKLNFSWEEQRSSFAHFPQKLPAHWAEYLRKVNFNMTLSQKASCERSVWLPYSQFMLHWVIACGWAASRSHDRSCAMHGGCLQQPLLKVPTIALLKMLEDNLGWRRLSSTISLLLQREMVFIEGRVPSEWFYGIPRIIASLWEVSPVPSLPVSRALGLHLAALSGGGTLVLPWGGAQCRLWGARWEQSLSSGAWWSLG